MRLWRGKMENYLRYFFFIICTSSYSQNKIDSLTIHKAEDILASYVPGLLRDSSYILYGLDERYILISKNNNYFTLYYISKNRDKEGKEIIKAENVQMIGTAFNSNSYKRRFFYANSEETQKYIHPHSNYVYFLLSKKGEKVCEFVYPLLLTEKGTHTELVMKAVEEFILNKYTSFWFKN